MTVKRRSPESKDTAIAAARAASDKQATDIVVLEVGPIFIISEYFVICSAANKQQSKAILDSIEKELREMGRKPRAREGVDSLQWALLDYGDVIVHVFDEEHRQYYELERLWGDAAVVEWEEGRALR